MCSSSGGSERVSNRYRPAEGSAPGTTTTSTAMPVPRVRLRRCPVHGDGIVRIRFSFVVGHPGADGFDAIRMASSLGARRLVRHPRQSSPPSPETICMGGAPALEHPCPCRRRRSRRLRTRFPTGPRPHPRRRRGHRELTTPATIASVVRRRSQSERRDRFERWFAGGGEGRRECGQDPGEQCCDHIRSRACCGVLRPRRSFGRRRDDRECRGGRSWRAW